MSDEGLSSELGAPVGDHVSGGPEVFDTGGVSSGQESFGVDDLSTSERSRMMDEAARAIEAILMVSDTPIAPHLLAQLLEVSPATIEAVCDQLSQDYAESGRGFVLVRVAGGYRFQSHPDLAPYVERFVLEGQSARLSAAALETLAIVAYKQPVSRAQVAAIRGVNADGVLRTLLQRGYVAEVGRDPGPGQAVLYGTTSVFLERLGLDRIDQLPPLADFVPGPEVMEALEQSLRADPAPARDVPTESAGPGSLLDLTPEDDVRPEGDLTPKDELRSEPELTPEPEPVPDE
jgi:segregation and condensation protein B